MNIKSTLWLIVGLTLGITLTFNQVTAQKIKDPNVHFEQLVLSAPPDQFVTFDIPRADTFTRIEVTIEPIREKGVLNGITFDVTSGPMLMSGVATVDGGTNRAAFAPAINLAFGEYWDARMTFDSARKKVKIGPTPSADPQYIISGNIIYHVNLWF